MFVCYISIFVFLFFSSCFSYNNFFIFSKFEICSYQNSPYSSTARNNFMKSYANMNEYTFENFVDAYNDVALQRNEKTLIIFEEKLMVTENYLNSIKIENVENIIKKNKIENEIEKTENKIQENENEIENNNENKLNYKDETEKEKNRKQRILIKAQKHTIINNMYLSNEEIKQQKQITMSIIIDTAKAHNIDLKLLTGLFLSNLFFDLYYGFLNFYELEDMLLNLAEDYNLFLKKEENGK